MELVVRKFLNYFEIQANDEDGYSCSYSDIIDRCKISPFDFYRIFVKYDAIWSAFDGCYKFNNKESAIKVIEKIESYLILNKLME